MAGNRTRDDKLEALIGRNLRRFRERRQLTQTELGDRFGVTFQQIQKYEKGNNRMSASLLFRAAGFLKVPMAHFFR